jgi:signal transduction histidine kinase/ligand-binding sensor protein
MPDPEPVSPPTHADESVLYAQLFADCLPEMRKFLDVLFASIFQAWGALVLIAIKGDDDYRAVEAASSLTPLCTAINDLGLRDHCIECDKRRTHEVARSREPLEYWCDWGLRDIAVPILIHGVTVGVILCGQKRLEGEDDLEGQRQLEKFATANDIEDMLPELREKRNLCPSVSPPQVKELVDILWATSQFISQMLYNKLDIMAGSARAAAGTLKALFAGFHELDGNHMTPESYWSALDKPLQNLSTAFDSRCIAVVLESAGKYQVVASHGLEGAKLQVPPEAHLISSTVKDFTGPEHLALTEQSFAECFLTSQVREIYPSANMVVFDKSRLGDDRILHLLAYFDPTLPHRNHLFLHQKKQILSLFLREMASFILHAEREEQLQKKLEDKNAMLQDVVHQINQPLHGILADCDNLVSDNFSKDRKATILRYLPYRVKQLAREVKLIQYAGKEGFLRSIEHHLYSVNLSKFLIENAMELQGFTSAEGKSVQIKVDTGVSDSLGEVLIDRENVAMALTNVVYNAVKYAFPGTTVTIRPEVTIRKLSILVIDDGLEIKPSEREAIFSKYVRTELAMEFSQSGLGIGLFVTRELMRSMGGDAVVVDSIHTGGAYKHFREHRTTIALILPQSVVLRSGGIR